MHYLGVTGSREVRDRTRVLLEMSAASAHQETFLVVGDQSSKDLETDEMYGLDWIAWGLWTGPDNPHRDHGRRFIADWQRYHRRAGMIRNTEMVGWVSSQVTTDPSATAQWLAFFQTGAQNKGTTMCANLARRQGIEVTEIWLT